MNITEVKSLIEAVIPHAEIAVEGEGCNFTVRVISPHFAGQSQVQRQRAVMAPFKERILSGELHALTVKTLTPEER
ncbi:MAG: BolA family protein [Halothiobacillaceae bacterium]|nr:MAG: BolA family protein [Halothiobacillaceae bacterium]